LWKSEPIRLSPEQIPHFISMFWAAIGDLMLILISEALGLVSRKCANLDAGGALFRGTSVDDWHGLESAWRASTSEFRFEIR
jgi:hypothetical protein